jgi:hypothetical protein
MKKILIFLIVVILISSPISVFANQNDLPNVNLSPVSFFYPLKRIYEKAIIRFYFNSNRKVDYYKSLVQERLAELNYVVEKEYLSEVEKSSQRFSYQVGSLTDFIVDKKFVNMNADLGNLFKKDRVILERLRDNYPANSSFWMLIQHSINSIDINQQKLKS